MTCVRLIDVENVLSSLQQITKLRSSGLSGFTAPITTPNSQFGGTNPFGSIVEFAAFARQQRRCETAGALLDCDVIPFAELILIVTISRYVNCGSITTARFLSCFGVG